MLFDLTFVKVSTPDREPNLSCVIDKEGRISPMIKSSRPGAHSILNASALSMAIGISISGLGLSAQAATPTLSEADFEASKTTYFQRCAGCHGTLRKGATGKNLEPKETLKLGQERLEKIISFGTEGGMNNFDDIMTKDEISKMATYIQMEAPIPPEMSLALMKERHKVS